MSVEESKDPEASRFYPIGTPGKPWNEEERAQWRATTKIQRSYKDEVIDKIDALRGDFDVSQYGSLSHDPERYPLYIVKSKDWSPEKDNVLITGGVHGYETSGVQGMLFFFFLAFCLEARKSMLF